MTRLAYLLAVGLAAVSTASAATTYNSIAVYDPTQTVFRRLVLFDDGSTTCVGTCAQTGSGGAGVDPTSIYYIVDPALIDISQTGSPTNVYRPGFGYRAIFGIYILGPDDKPYLGFNPASQDTPAFWAPTGSLVALETVFLDATPYLHPDLRQSGYTAQFTNGAAAPEPGTFALIAAGAVLFFVRLRSCRSSAA